MSIYYFIHILYQLLLRMYIVFTKHIHSAWRFYMSLSREMKISYIRKVRYKGITEDVSNHMSLTRQLLYLSHIGKTFILILGTIIKAQHHIDCCFIYSTFQNQCGQIHHSFKQLVAISKYKCSIHKCWSCCCIVYTLLYIIIISMGGMNLQKKKQNDVLFAV